MEETNYTKPMLKFVQIRNEEKVAARCWGGHIGAGNLTWYYDVSGDGWMSFKIGTSPNPALSSDVGVYLPIANGNGNGNSCSLNLIDIYYYNGDGVMVEEVSTNDKKYVEMYEALMAAGGAEGNSFAGEGVKFPIDNPGEDWS